MLFPLQNHQGSAEAARLFVPNIIIQDLISRSGRSLAQGGKIDTGARKTIIPIKMASELNMSEIGEVLVRGFDNRAPAMMCPQFYIRLKIPDLIEASLWVVGCDRDEILLGRDICQHMLLAASWRDRWFGLLCRKPPDGSLRSIFE